MACAAARAAARETPRIAFAPRRDLSRVWSSSISAASSAAWSEMSMPITFSAISFSTFQTAFCTPLPPYRVAAAARGSGPGCVVSEAGVEPGGAGVRPQQSVEVLGVEGLVRARGGYRNLLRCRYGSQLRVVLVEVGCNMHEVVGRHAVTGGVKPAWIDEVAGCKADARGLLVPLADEPLARHNAPRQCLGGVIARVEEQAVEQLAHS